LTRPLSVTRWLALDALENGHIVELLVTCVEFQPGRASASRADDGALIRANVGRERHVVEAGQGGFCRSNASACASHWAAISRKRRSNSSPIGRLLASARACCAFARSSAGVSAGGGSFGMVGERTAKRKNCTFARHKPILTGSVMMDGGNRKRFERARHGKSDTLGASATDPANPPGGSQSIRSSHNPLH
jgi:hypothetical protein